MLTVKEQIWRVMLGKAKDGRIEQQEVTSLLDVSTSTVHNALIVPRRAGAVGGRGFLVVDRMKLNVIWAVFLRRHAAQGLLRAGPDRRHESFGAHGSLPASGLSISEIAERIGSDRPWVSQVVERLRQEGLLEHAGCDGPAPRARAADAAEPPGSRPAQVPQRRAWAPLRQHPRGAEVRCLHLPPPAAHAFDQSARRARHR